MDGKNYGFRPLKTSLVWLIGCAILLDLAGCAPDSYTPQAREFKPEACPTYLRGIGNIDFTCGELLVPENRAKADGRTISIQVGMIKSRSKTPAPDPLLYLPGGPGSSGLEEVIYNLAAFEGLLEAYDMIIFDPRGVGYSSPKLDCAEYDTAFFDGLDDLPYLETQDEEYQAFLDCHDRLYKQSEIDVSQYHNREIARDIEDLRLSLGIQQWNLLGSSYGTRLALTLLRDFPTSVRSAILDSTIPPEVEPEAGWVFSFERAVTRMFERCAMDAQCQAAYPDLEQDFYRVFEKFDQTPETVHGLDYRGNGYDVAVDGDVWLALVFISFYSRDQIAGLPLLVDNILDGDTAGLRDALTNYLSTPSWVDYGAYFSVHCTDEAPFTSLATLKKDVADAQPVLRRANLLSSQMNLRVCEHWKHINPGKPENSPVQSDVPTLILAGEFDPVTPPEWGKNAAATLTQAYFYEFTGLTHGVSMYNTETAGCVERVMLSFLANPTDAPEAACVAELVPLSFTLP